jgi:hypothetical protein
MPVLLRRLRVRVRERRAGWRMRLARTLGTAVLVAPVLACAVTLALLGLAVMVVVASLGFFLLLGVLVADGPERLVFAAVLLATPVGFGVGVGLFAAGGSAASAVAKRSREWGGGCPS